VGGAAWPELPRLEDWQDTVQTVHRWSQVLGKVRLAQTPWINHSWHVPLYVTGRGLTTSPIFYGARAFEMDFDFIDHQLRVATSDGQRRSFDLEPMAVADFYARTVGAIRELGIDVRIWPVPVEIPGPVYLL
jgi:hypothetical protein